MKKYETYPSTVKVIKDLGVDKNRHHYYLCECPKCKKAFKAIQTRVFSGKQILCQSCVHMKDYTGMRIGDYIVIGATGKKTASRNLIWKCRCIRCKAVREISTNQLQTNKNLKCKCKTSQNIPKLYIDQIF